MDVILKRGLMSVHALRLQRVRVRVRVRTIILIAPLSQLPTN